MQRSSLNATELSTLRTDKMTNVSRLTPDKVWIPHSSPTLGPQEVAAVLRCLQCGYVGNGTAAKELEDRIRTQTGRKYAFAVSSGFHGLLLALRALDLPRGSKICLPILTCASVLAASQNSGLYADLADIDPETLTLDVDKVSRDCAAVIAPHAYGAPVHGSKLQDLGLPWIEDCATSPATRVDGYPAGALGTFAIFSFSSTKYVTAGSGGVLACNDDGLAARVEDLLNFDSFEKRGDWKNGWHGAVPGRMSDLNASLANVQFDRMSEFSCRRREIAKSYDAQLRDVPGITLMEPIPEHSYYRYIIRTDKPSIETRELLRGFGIDARTSVNPWLDRVPSMFGPVLGGPWPSAEAWRNNLLSLPIHPSMSDEDAAYVAKSLRRVLISS